jgi:outer membrane lipoprotein-sorting protein
MNEERIEEILKNIGSEDVPADVHKIADQTARDFTKTLMQTRHSKRYVLWEYIMKSKITQLAAAAVIIIAVLIGVNQFFGGTVTFAQVIQPILNARTVVFDFIVGGEETGPVIHDIVAGSKIRRTFSNMGTIMIIDLDNAKMLTLDPKSKGAVYIDIKGPLQEQTTSFLEFIRNAVTNLKDMPVLELGQRDIDGRKAVGFFVADKPHLELTIWADQQTASPIRIELQMGQSLYILKNIEFDVPVEDRLVSMDVPDGYTLQKTEVDMSGFNEADFIETLRIWAEYLLDGWFPEKISIEDLMNQTAAIGEKIGQMDIPDEQKMQLGMTFGRGTVFFQQLDPSRIDWHYAGKGVKFGDAETTVFWYRPKGSETYRVIYGDLSVEDVEPENLSE